MQSSTGASRPTSTGDGASVTADLFDRAARMVAQEWRVRPVDRLRPSPWMVDEIRRGWPELAVALDFLSDAAELPRYSAEAAPRSE